MWEIHTCIRADKYMHVHCNELIESNDNVERSHDVQTVGMLVFTHAYVLSVNSP